ncbi:hypothetical protein D3C71_1538180 [compost metagenome]
MVGQVRQRDLLRGGQGVLGAHHQAQRFAVELVVVHRHAGNRRHVGAGQAAHDDVDVARGQRGQQLRGRPFAHGDLDAGVVGHQARDGFGQQFGGRGNQRAHHHVASGPAQHRVDVVGHVAHFGQHGVNAPPQHQGKLGGRDAPVRPFKQGCAEEGFQVVDGLGDGGLGQVQFAGRARQ